PTSCNGTATTRCWPVRCSCARWPRISGGSVDSDSAPRGWRHDSQLWLEVFVAGNFAGLVLDIFLAHSSNRFRHAAEYIPLYFSAAAALTLAVIVTKRRRHHAVWRDVGHLIGWLSIAVGVAG